MDEEELKAFRKEVAAYCGVPYTEPRKRTPEEEKQLQNMLKELERIQQEHRRRRQEQANGEASSSDR